MPLIWTVGAWFPSPPCAPAAWSSISIEDNGPGMPPKARENLFAAFRGSARSGGTGLGLAIARELVLAHGGTIALVEKATPGTLFRIELPDRPVPLDVFRSKARH